MRCMTSPPASAWFGEGPNIASTCGGDAGRRRLVWVRWARKVEASHWLLSRDYAAQPGRSSRTNEGWNASM